MRLSTCLTLVLCAILCSVCSQASILIDQRHIFENVTLGEQRALDEMGENGLEEPRRKKKDRFTFSIIIAALMVKMILLPLAFKAMAVMSSVAVMLSALSLVATSIIGYTKLAWSEMRTTNRGVKFDDFWTKDDAVINNYADDFAYEPVEEHFHYYQRRST